MRFGRVLVSLLLLAGISVVGSAAPAAVADTPVSQGPPTCPPGGQPGDLGCPVDFEATISAAPPSLSPGSTISITRSIPYPPCATAESIDCYNRFSNPTFGGVCVYMNGGLSTDFRRCNVWLEINLSDRGFWVRPGTTSTTFACDALFNEAFYAGGSVDDTFAGIAPGRLPCEIQMRDDFTLQRLQGPTWMPWSFTYDVTTHLTLDVSSAFVAAAAD